ncbi:universal stress protein [Paraburkholderia sp.]|jgi:nucleotide-binding universal stress UspA family protein|uniref:universal stress protein n=1 Tax=Paraburkholderia sp. TaxID=1926495 RepID=UPI003C7D2D42
MYANILVAVDGSEASKYAVNEAIRVAKLSGGKLTAVHGMRRMAIGSVAERFLRQSTCPVLLIREAWTGA